MTTYNNFYEFGIDKDAPSQNAGSFKVKPWSVKVEGEVAKPATYTLEDILRSALARRTRLSPPMRRSLVDGHPVDGILAGRSLIDSAHFAGQVRGVRDAARSQGMPRQRRGVLEWPYLEGLRLDEAMHPLTTLAAGCTAKPCRLRMARRCG